MNAINNYAKNRGFVFNHIFKDYVCYGPTWIRKSIPEMLSMFKQERDKKPEKKESF